MGYFDFLGQVAPPKKREPIPGDQDFVGPVQEVQPPPAPEEMARTLPEDVASAASQEAEALSGMGEYLKPYESNPDVKTVLERVNKRMSGEAPYSAEQAADDFEELRKRVPALSNPSYAAGRGGKLSGGTTSSSISDKLKGVVTQRKFLADRLKTLTPTAIHAAADAFEKRAQQVESSVASGAGVLRGGKAAATASALRDRAAEIRAQAQAAPPEMPSPQKVSAPGAPQSMAAPDAPGTDLDSFLAGMRLTPGDIADAIIETSDKLGLDLDRPVNFVTALQQLTKDEFNELLPMLAAESQRAMSAGMMGPQAAMGRAVEVAGQVAKKQAERKPVSGGEQPDAASKEVDDLHGKQVELAKESSLQGFVGTLLFVLTSIVIGPRMASLFFFDRAKQGKLAADIDRLKAIIVQKRRRAEADAANQEWYRRLAAQEGMRGRLQKEDRAEQFRQLRYRLTEMRAKQGRGQEDDPEMRILKGSFDRWMKISSAYARAGNFGAAESYAQKALEVDAMIVERAAAAAKEMERVKVP